VPPAEARAQVGQGDDLQFDFLVIRKRPVVELFIFAHGTHGIHRIRANQQKGFCIFPISVCSVCSVGYPVEKISSLQNPRIKELVRLRDRRPRDETGVFLVEGYREIRRALEKNVALRELYYAPEWFSGNEPALIEQAHAAGAQLFELSKDAFAKVAYRERPDGLLGVAPQWRRSLDDLTSPLRRFCSWSRRSRSRAISHDPAQRRRRRLRCRDCLRSGHRYFQSNVVRASTGVLFSVPLVVAESAQVFAWLRANKIHSVATTPAPKPLHDGRLPRRLAIVMGSEQYAQRVLAESADLP